MGRAELSPYRAAINGIFWECDMKIKEWNGEGVPPIGVFCEYYRPDSAEWRKCEVVAHHHAKVVAIDVRDSTAVYLVASFRPIKTPEQIAAEERLQAIDEMMGLAERYGTVKGIMSALYDAGYRKMEEDE